MCAQLLQSAPKGRPGTTVDPTPALTRAYDKLAKYESWQAELQVDAADLAKNQQRYRRFYVSVLAISPIGFFKSPWIGAYTCITGLLIFAFGFYVLGVKKTDYQLELGNLKRELRVLRARVTQLGGKVELPLCAATLLEELGPPQSAKHAEAWVAYAAKLQQANQLDARCEHAALQLRAQWDPAWAQHDADALTAILRGCGSALLTRIVEQLGRANAADDATWALALLTAMPADVATRLSALALTAPFNLAPSARAALLRAACTLDCGQATTWMMAALGDEDRELRIEAARNLSNYAPSTASCNALQMQLANERDPGVYSTLQRAIAKLQQKQGVTEANHAAAT